LDSVRIQLLLFVDNSPPHNLVVVMVEIMEVRYNPSQVPKGWVHTDRYLHLLVNNRDNLVGHVVVLIFGGIVHRRVVDELWLMDICRHKFSAITMVRSATFMSVVLTFTHN
jgi:hypothetical protein